MHCCRKSLVAALAGVALCLSLAAKLHASAASRLPPAEFVTVDGVRLAYVSVGRGEPLVLVSGGPGAAHYLYPYFSALADTHRVIYLESFGTGRSDRAKPPARHTFARHVQDIEALRRGLNLGPINVLGHSYGSLVVQAYALQHPDSLRRVILAAPIISAEAMNQANAYLDQAIRLHFPDTWRKLDSLRERRVDGSAPEAALALQEIPEAFLYYGNVNAAGKLLLDFNPQVNWDIAGTSLDLKVGGDFAGLDFRPTLKTVRAPMLVLAARYDRVCPPQLTLEYRTHAPTAQFVLFEQSGHNLFLEENARMLDTLRAFLGDRRVATD